MSEQQKPGVKTTEWWAVILTLAPVVAGILVSLANDNHWIAAVLAMGACGLTSAYVFCRSWLKKEEAGEVNLLTPEQEKWLKDTLAKADEILQKLKPPSGPSVMTILLIGVLLFGCTGCGLFVKSNPKAELLAAREVFAGTVNSLAVMREAGRFTKAEAETVGMYIALAADTLNQWEAEIRLGQDSKGSVEIWRQLLKQLTAAAIAAERKQSNGKSSVAPGVGTGDLRAGQHGPGDVRRVSADHGWRRSDRRAA